MYDVLNILDNYVRAIKAAQTPEIIISNIRSFTKLLQSTALEPIIVTLKEQKYSDLGTFQKTFSAFQVYKKNAFFPFLLSSAQEINHLLPFKQMQNVIDLLMNFSCLLSVKKMLF